MTIGQLRRTTDDQHVRTRDECPVCGREAAFEQPPCIDGHTEDGGNCPEWICTDCGAALLGEVHVVRRPHRAG